MVALAHDAMAEGALGISSSLGEAHTDGDDEPVPSRGAAPDEFLALAAAVRDHPGTTLEFIAAMGEIPRDRAELMAEMSLAADRPLNWNLLGSLSPVEVYEQQLTSCDLAAARGATVVALALPDLLRMRSDRVLTSLPEWDDVWSLSDTERARALADPGVRARRRALHVQGALEVIALVENEWPYDVLLVPAAHEHDVSTAIHSCLTPAGPRRFSRRT